MSRQSDSLKVQSSDGWRPLFGRWWSPKDYKLIQRLELTDKDYMGAQLIHALLYRVQSEKEHSFFIGLSAGWISAMLFVAAVWKFT